MLNLRSTFTYLVVFFLFLGCTDGNDSPAEKITRVDVTLDEVLVFGSDESASPDALLGGPRYVRTDGGGNIYVADRKPLGVKVYDSTGTYLRTIGAEGEGPGEFRDITSMTINSRDELLVADWHAQRMLRFTAAGEALSTRTLEKEEIMWPRYIEQFPNGRYVMLFRRTESARKDSGGSGPARLIHIFNEQLEKISSFATVPDLWADTRPYAVKTSGFEPGKVTIVDRNELVYVPTLYRGKLYRFRGEKGQWTLVQTLEGRVHRKEAYTPLEEAPERENRPPNVNVIYSRGDVFPAAVHNKSEALFTLSDGRLVHFSVIQEGEERYLQVELFTEDGQLTGWGRIDDFDRAEEDDPKSPPWARISWKDEENRFYVIDYRSHPTVRVVNLSFAPVASEDT